MGAPGPDHFDRNALLERIELRLEIARQGRCQVTLECLERLETPASTSLTQQVHKEMPKLAHTKIIFQNAIDSARIAHDQEAHVRRDASNRTYRRHYESSLSAIRGSYHDVETHGQLSEQINHIELQQALDKQLRSFGAVRTRYLDLCALPAFARSKDFEMSILHNVHNYKDEGYITKLDGIGKNVWRDATSMVGAWRFRQHKIYQHWLDYISATLQKQCESQISELQGEVAALHEAVGELQSLGVFDYGVAVEKQVGLTRSSSLRAEDHSILHSHAKTKLALMSALAKCLKLTNRAHIGLCLETLLLGFCTAGDRERLIFDLQRQAQHPM